MKNKKVSKNRKFKKNNILKKKIYCQRKKKIIIRKHYKKRIKKIPEIEVPTATSVIILDVETPTPKKRGRRSKGTSINKMYFTQDTEDSIVAYNSSSDIQVREDIYNSKIKYPFEKLVENIFNTFKFSYFETSPLDVQKETITHLVSNIHKFEAGRGKAFSYFSIIAKHYLIALNNSTYKRRNQHVEISEEHDEHSIQLQTEDKHHKDAEMHEFLRLMIEFWENNVGKIFTKQRDLDIANAVIELFRQTDNISLFNKKALYLYIREISNCRTQQITKIINKMRQYQTNIRKSYIVSGSINTKSYIKV